MAALLSGADVTSAAILTPYNGQVRLLNELIRYGTIYSNHNFKTTLTQTFVVCVSSINLQFNWRISILYKLLQVSVG